MIRSFADPRTEEVFHGNSPRGFPPDILANARRRLDQINHVDSLRDLAVPPGNRLERFLGNLKDFYSVRVGRQWRIIFRWRDGHAYDVELIDYH